MLGVHVEALRGPGGVRMRTLTGTVATRRERRTWVTGIV